MGSPSPPHTAKGADGLCGSGLSTGGICICALPNLTPVTCCTIWRKLAGSAVIKVVWFLLDALDLRLETFPPVGGIAEVVLCRLGAAAVSGSGGGPAEIPETVGVGSVGWAESEEMRSRKEEKAWESEGRREVWRALVRD